MYENLLDPLFLFFMVGFIAGILKSDLKLPDAVYQLLSTYLLLAIGLKGGVQLAQASVGHIAGPILATFRRSCIIWGWPQVSVISPDPFWRRWRSA